jgi:hypothetical protein
VWAEVLHSLRGSPTGRPTARKQLIEASKFRAVVDRTYPMSEAAEAHRYVDSWRKAGNVVLTIP